MRFRPSLVLPVSVLLLAPVASADVFWNEAVDGDLSNDRLAPNAFTLSPGANSLLATTGGGNLDYLSITVPAGAQFTELRLISYQGDDEIAFVAVQSGAVFTEAPEFPDQANLLGWAHFGPFNIDSDILDDIGGGFGAIGFTPPLPGGTYTFWLQQLGTPVSYQMDFTIVPAPTAAALLFIGAAATGGAGRRRR